MKAPNERDVQILRVLRAAVLTGALAFLAVNTVADPDLWGHVRFGHDMVAARSVRVPETYSFTSDRPWINHEWLAEVLIYGAYAAGGSAGLVTLKMVLIAGVLACMFAVLRRRHWRPADHDLLVTAVVVGMLPRLGAVRPQLFSFLLFAALLLALTLADRGRRRALVGVPLLFAVWANLHGGFLVGLATLAIWLVVRGMQRRSDWLLLSALGTASVAATLLTPYGVNLWWFLRTTVGLSRPEITDWQPVYSHPGLYVPCLVVVLTGALALWRGRARVDPAAMGILAALVVGTLRVGRVDAFLAIGVGMLLGPSFGRPTSPTPAVRWRAWVTATVGIVLLSGPIVFGRQASCLQVDYSAQNVPEPEVAAFLRTRQGRLLTFFDWGQYAIWHFPALKVSMDGRRETVYSEALTAAHIDLYKGRSLALVQRLHPDLVWLPNTLPAVAELEREGWRQAFQGPVSTVLTLAQGPVQHVSHPWSGARCFPGD